MPEGDLVLVVGATVLMLVGSNSRIVANAAKLLADKGSGKAVISICAAGGQGVVAILEAAK